MSVRKTPVLLRRGPVSGDVIALLRYTYTQTPRGEVLEASSKENVTADFTALMLEELIGSDAPNIVGILDGIAAVSESGAYPLTDDERAQVRAFRERLKLAVERHNERGHGRPA